MFDRVLSISEWEHVVSMLPKNLPPEVHDRLHAIKWEIGLIDFEPGYNTFDNPKIIFSEDETAIPAYMVLGLGEVRIGRTRFSRFFRPRKIYLFLDKSLHPVHILAD